CEGGSYNLAKGLLDTFLANGGTFAAGSSASRIVVEGGRATGVELADGRTVKARQFVASTVDVHQTFEQMVGREQLPGHYLEKIDRFKYTAWTLFGVHLALRAPPAYTASAFDPNLGKALKY